MKAGTSAHASIHNLINRGLEVLLINRLWSFIYRTKPQPTTTPTNIPYLYADTLLIYRIGDLFRSSERQN